MELTYSREIYLKPFEIAIKAARPWCVMTSYNLVNGIHADSNEFLLRRVLRQEWGWEGLVVSDWGGTNSAAESIIAGMDLEMPGPAVRRTSNAVTAAAKSGKLREDDIDKCVAALLKLLKRAGKFEHPGIPPERAIDLPEHRALIRRAGGKGIVLLKNDNDILPLNKETLKSVAALGLAKECLAHGGGSAAVNSHYTTTPLDSLKKQLGESVDIRYSKGARTFRNLPDWAGDVVDMEGKQRFTISCYASLDMSGAPVKTIDSNKASYIPLGERFGSVKIVGTYSPPEPGSHYLSLAGLGPTKLFINNTLILEQPEPCTDSMAFLLGGHIEQECQYYFEVGEAYHLRIESEQPKADGNGNFLMDGLLGTRLGFMTQEGHEENLIPGAVQAARHADVALVFVGNPMAWETEGQDRATMSLPAYGSQDKLIEAVCEVNRNVVVVNSTGVPVAMQWIEKVSAVVQAWFGGQESGNSIVDVLTGATNPGAKLPVTFPKRLEGTPCFDHFPGNVEKLEVRYEEGIYMGYRYYDMHPHAVLFPFGFGLSYTTFEFSSVRLTSQTMPPWAEIVIRTEVENTGSRDGCEVVQVYVSLPGSSIDVPKKQLAGFTKVNLSAGESKVVEITIGHCSASFWDEKVDRWVVERGTYGVLVGNSSQNIVGQGEFVVHQGYTFQP
jgi:beta-glucosidase